MKPFWRLQKFVVPALSFWALSLTNIVHAQNYMRNFIDTELSGANDVEAFDLDQDGDLDIVACGLTTGVVAWYENEGDDNFVKRVIGTPGLASHLFVSDLNDDGFFDIVVTRFEVQRLNPTSLIWFENNGSQVFTEREINSEHNFWRLFVVDLNGNGIKDIVTTTADGALRTPILWFENNGIEIFTKHVIEADLDNPYGVIAADLDGDVNNDLVFTISDDSEVIWYEHLGLASFSKTVIDQDAPTVSNVTAADIDDDGDTDLLTASFAGTLTLYNNNGFGSFTKSTLYQRAGSDFWEILVSDMDGDSDKDIVTTSIQTTPFFSPSLFFLVNEGASTFRPEVIESQFVLRGAAIGAAGEEGFRDIFAVSNLGSSVLQFKHVTPPDFQLKVIPESQSVISGSVAAFSVLLDSLEGGFDQVVALSISPDVAEITSSFEPFSISPGDTSTLIFQTTPQTPIGDYQFVVTGTSGTLVRSDTLVLRFLAPEENTISLAADTIQTAGDAFWIDVNIGSEIMPIGALFGASFVLNYESAHSEILPPFSENILPGDFLGERDEIIFFASPPAGDSGSIAVTRRDGAANVSGFGNLARVRFRTFPDTPDSMRLHFTLSTITANDSAKNRVILHPQDLWVTVLKRRDVVWPGDTDNNGIVNQADVLPVGFYWHSAGPRRKLATLDWQAQTAILWPETTATFADADGGGKVNEADVIPIGLNWGRTHDLNKATANAAQNYSGKTGVIKAQIAAGNSLDVFFVDFSVAGIDNLYGAAFEFGYPANEFEVISVKPSEVWSSSPLFYSKNNRTDGALGIAISFTDKQGAEFSGEQIVRVHIKPKNVLEHPDVSRFAIRDAVAMNKSGEMVGLEPETATAFDETSVIPTEFRLEQNYPNPFNPETIIRYQLPKNSRVSISIFDMRGAKIKTLFQKEQEPGVFEIVWNGTNKAGERVSSGVYFYRIIAGDFQAVKKCILMK